MKVKKKRKQLNNILKDKTIIYVLLIVLFELFMYVIEPYVSGFITLFFILLTILLIIIYSLYCKKNKCFNYKTLTYLFIMIGVLLRTMYMFKTSIYERQHDVYTLDINGHLRYIYDLFMTGKLPSSNDFQFYQPPLFHALAALWLKINSTVGVSLERSMEGIQVLTTIFSSLTMLVTYKIIDKIKIKEKYKFILNLFMVVFPTFITLSGSINNDCLLTLLLFMTILYIIKWYEKPNWSNTIILGLVTGLSVMTKLNGAIMAISILYVFIKKLVEYYKTDKDKLKYLIIKIIVFALISLPIGLWYQVRELIMFGSNSIPVTSDTRVDVSSHSLFERFFTVSFSSLSMVFVYIFAGEYSIFSNLVKTSLFSEYVFYQSKEICSIMLVLNILLIIISTLYIFKYVIKKKNYTVFNNILLITWITNIISYIIFNIEYPFTTTMDFRYIIPTVLTGIIFTIYNIDNKKNNILTILTKTFLYMFLLLCFIFPYTI